jgi:hypothetical protein
MKEILLPRVEFRAGDKHQRSKIDSEVNQICYIYDNHLVSVFPCHREVFRRQS